MPFGERDALVRTAEGMSQYAAAADTAATANSGIGFFPEYSHPASCVPDLPQRESSNPTRCDLSLFRCCPKKVTLDKAIPNLFRVESSAQERTTINQNP